MKPILNLNKHPKDCENLSLVEAINVRLSNDGSCLQTEEAIVDVEAINRKLLEDYTWRFNIIDAISCNKELIIFVKDDDKVEPFVDIYRYNEDLNIIQININCFKDNLYEKNLPLIDFKLSNIKNNQVLIDNLIIYMLNVVKCSEVYYNESNEEIPKYIRWRALIYCTDISKIPSITEGILTEKECNLIMDKLNEITTEDLFMTKEEALEWADWTENTIYDKGIKIGMTQGRIEGITQGKIEGNQYKINDR